MATGIHRGADKELRGQHISSNKSQFLLSDMAFVQKGEAGAGEGII